VGHAGGKAIYDFIIELKKRDFKVCLVSMAWPDEECQLERLNEICDGTFFLVSKPVFTDSFLRSFQSNPLLFGPKILRGCLKHLRVRNDVNRGIRELIRRHRPDVVQVEYTTMLLYLRKLDTPAMKILDLHDVMSKPFQRFYMAEKNLAVRLWRYLFFVLVRRLELSFCRGFDRILVKSNYDKKVLLKQANFRTQTFPLGVQPVPGIVPYARREPRSVLFLGAMFREVNERAVVFFLQNVMPALEREVGPVTFYIVGTSPSEKVRQLASSRVIVTGYVADVSEFYRRCQVFVAPLFVGGGMIFKILQAMSYGLPVVSSTIGNEGIEATDGEQILIADKALDFSRKLASLMNDAGLWEKLSVQAQKFVNSRYAWDRVIEDYLLSLDGKKGDVGAAPPSLTRNLPTAPVIACHREAVKRRRSSPGRDGHSPRPGRGRGSN
jgi:glycosyltransferase involved in cell wall biosynthesis